MRALPILLALTATAAAEAAAPLAKKITLPAAQIQVPVAPQRRTPPKSKPLLPILLEDSWHYQNPDRERSTWDFADVTFSPRGVLLITEHAASADLVLRGTWRATDASHITIERPYVPGQARYTLAACKDNADRISVCLFGPKL